MPCLDITLPGSLLNASGLPLAYNDAMISAGTLMLWEPAHPMDPFVGVPTAPTIANGTPPVTTLMPNIAQMSARNLLGDQSADVRVPFYRNDGCSTVTPNPNSDFAFERTAKGGLHFVASQSTEHDYREAGVGLPDAIKAYLIAHPTHEYFVSVWRRITRVALAQTPYSSPVHYIGADVGTSNNIMNQSAFGLEGSAPLGYSISSVNALGNESAQWHNTFMGTVPADISHLYARFGFALHPSYGTDKNKRASAIYYRILFEDLTASGRTWAAVKAIDDAKYAAAFASGGRYYGDTFTDAATLMN